MNLAQVKTKLFSGEIFYDRKIALLLWFALALLGARQALDGIGFNNYLIFKSVYYHTLHQQNLYLEYPSEYKDVNLYGPFFSLIIAPFAWLPDKAGALAWAMFNALFLFYAFIKLPLQHKWQTLLLFLCCHELMISCASLQINPIIAGCIILGFSYTIKGKDFWALLFIMAATFIKIYGIVGLAFFFFSKNKIQFIFSAIAWSIVLFFAPLLITSFNFLLQSYKDWLPALQAKNAKNILLDPGSIYQNVSALGMLRRIFYIPYLNDLVVLIPAATLFLSQYLHYEYFKDIRFRLYILCSVLLAVVVFSTGSESTTYIIAMPGMCIWYLLQRKTKWMNAFFIFAFVFTTFAYSDIFTPWSRSHLFRPYSLKALMPFIIWIIILLQIHTKQFLKAIFPELKKRSVLSVV